MSRYKPDEKQKAGVALLCGSLISVDFIILQAFISSGVTDIASFISVLCMIIAIPFLASELLIYLFLSKIYIYYDDIINNIAYLYLIFVFIDVVGIVAAIWHVNWIFGVVFLGSVILAFVHYAFMGYHMHKEISYKKEEYKRDNGTASRH